MIGGAGLCGREARERVGYAVINRCVLLDCRELSEIVEGIRYLLCVGVLGEVLCVCRVWLCVCDKVVR